MGKIKTENNLKQKTVNLFGSVGYFFCSMQWFWVISLYFSLIKLFAISTAPGGGSESQVAQPITATPDIVTVISPVANSFFIILSILITLVVIGATFFVIFKMPSTISKTSKNIVRGAAENVTPIILQIQHKKDTKKNNLKLTPLLILAMKIILIIVPVGLTFASQLVAEKFISFDIGMCIGFLLFCVSLAFFSIQYLLARLFLLKPGDIR